SPREESALAADAPIRDLEAGSPHLEHGSVDSAAVDRPPYEAPQPDRAVAERSEPSERSAPVWAEPAARAEPVERPTFTEATPREPHVSGAAEPSYASPTEAAPAAPPKA